MKPDLTVLVCTYNRSADLKTLLGSVCHQESEHFSFEVIVVDNNSTDSTATTVEEVRTQVPNPPRYLFEPRQGKSNALNTGLAAVRAPLCVIVDDDQLMPPGYLWRLVSTFSAHPDVTFIGGKVLPIWETPPPAWLTPDHWSPLGMADHGDESFKVGPQRPICLLTFAFRVADVLAVGGFRSELGVTGARIGSTEDADLIDRMVAAGKIGLYVPGLVLHHRAPAKRMTRAYYRRWHYGHGGFSALRREPAIESSAFRLLDVPAHLYRQALADTIGFVRSKTVGNDGEAFARQLGILFFLGFAIERVGSATRARPFNRVVRERGRTGMASIQGAEGTPRSYGDVVPEDGAV